MKTILSIALLLALTVGCRETIRETQTKVFVPVQYTADTAFLSNERNKFCNYILPKEYKILTNPSKSQFIVAKKDSYGVWEYMYIKQRTNGSYFWNTQQTIFYDSCEAKSAFIEIMDETIENFKPLK